MMALEDLATDQPGVVQTDINLGQGLGELPDFPFPLVGRCQELRTNEPAINILQDLQELRPRRISKGWIAAVRNGNDTGCDHDDSDTHQSLPVRLQHTARSPASFQ